jgi:hypothetical protein
VRSALPARYSMHGSGKRARRGSRRVASPLVAVICGDLRRAWRTFLRMRIWLGCVCSTGSRHVLPSCDGGTIDGRGTGRQVDRVAVAIASRVSDAPPPTVVVTVWLSPPVAFVSRAERKRNRRDAASTAISTATRQTRV